MFLEDLICEVVAETKKSRIDVENINFLSSLKYQIEDNKTLTTRQQYAARQVLRSYIGISDEVVSSVSVEDYERIVNEGSWRNKGRVTVEKATEARYLGDNLVAFNYSNKPGIQDRALELRGAWREGVYVVPVTTRNLENIITFIGEFRFGTDDALMEYLALCMASKGQTSHFLSAGEAVAINVCDSETVANFVLHILGGEIA